MLYTSVTLKSGDGTAASEAVNYILAGGTVLSVHFGALTDIAEKWLRI